MNTNSNLYTIVYTAAVVVVVAAILAFVAAKLGPAQDANAKAETLRQMMSAAGVSHEKTAEIRNCVENLDNQFGRLLCLL